ncbi:hypothetical protein [Nocardiopsis algeriensis]|uniref:Uncharacterized protein n=1 Tax=Nocardiopsis algeriensis TaxID=1478215 RepID=A0A841IT37_9ACTN|nr:hypothetical protein [Nocardiopsis algeriensis]MBB6121833.1 hypothetical protein [Nocardiopsis algeriensis]
MVDHTNGTGETRHGEHRWETGSAETRPAHGDVSVVDAEVTDPGASTGHHGGAGSQYANIPGQRSSDAEGQWQLRPRGFEPEELQLRWREAQGEFVDDPQRAVREADALAEKVAGALVSEIESRQAALRSAWGDGRNDTESLRVALQDYRSFLEHLTGSRV